MDDIIEMIKLNESLETIEMYYSETDFNKYEELFKVLSQKRNLKNFTFFKKQDDLTPEEYMEIERLIGDYLRFNYTLIKLNIHWKDNPFKFRNSRFIQQNQKFNFNYDTLFYYQ